MYPRQTYSGNCWRKGATCIRLFRVALCQRRYGDALQIIDAVALKHHDYQFVHESDLRGARADSA